MEKQKAEELNNKPSVEERSSAKELLGEMSSEAEGETRMLEFVRQHSNLVNVKEPAVSPSYQKKHINNILEHKDLLATQLKEGFEGLGEEEQQLLLDPEGGTPEQQLQRLYDELVPMDNDDDDDDTEDDPVHPPLVVERITRSRSRRDDSSKQTVAATPPVKGTGTAHSSSRSSSRRRRRGRSSPASPTKRAATARDRRRGRSSTASTTKRAATARDRRLSPALLVDLGPDNVARYYIQFGKFLRRSASCWEEQTKAKKRCWKTIHEMVAEFDKVKEAADCLLKLQAHELEHTSHDAYGKPKPIGEGGFAKVYRMKEKADNGRLFALKLLDSDTEKNVKELTREAQIQMKFIDHPVIVKVVDYGITGIYAWILLEWINGCNLEDYSKDYDEQRFGDFVPNQAAQTFLAAAVPALYHFRLKCIGHRDLKPDNFLLEGNVLTKPKVADFGESQFVRGKTCKTESGTPPYRCPRMDGKHGDYCPYRGDIHAFGWTVVALAVGVERYENYILVGKGNKEEVWKWVEEANVSREGIDLLKRMTHEDPEKRPSLYEIGNHQWVVAGKNLLDGGGPYASDCVKFDVGIIEDFGKQIEELELQIEELKQQRAPSFTPLGHIAEEPDLVPGVSFDSQDEATASHKSTAPEEPWSWLIPEDELSSPSDINISKVSNPNTKPSYPKMPKDEAERKEKSFDWILMQIACYSTYNFLEFDPEGKTIPSGTDHDRLGRLLSYTSKLGYHAKNTKKQGKFYNNLWGKKENRTKEFEQYFPNGFSDFSDPLLKVAEPPLKELYLSLRNLHEQGQRSVQSRHHMKEIVVDAFTRGFSGLDGVDDEVWKKSAESFSVRLWDVHQY